MLRENDNPVKCCSFNSAPLLPTCDGRLSREVLCGGYNYDLTSVHWPFDWRSTAYQRSLRLQ